MSFTFYYLQMPELFQSHQPSFLVLFHDWLLERETRKGTVLNIMLNVMTMCFSLRNYCTAKSSPIMVSVPTMGGVWLGTPKLLEPEWSPAG